MTKTVDVVAGEIVASAWGNEIRDRTFQQFTDRPELLAQWPAAPEGSRAWLRTNHVLMVKMAGGWSPERQWGTISGTTNASGGFVITYPIPFVDTPVVFAIDGDAGSAGVRYFGLVAAQIAVGTQGFAIFDNAGPWASKAVRVQWQAHMR